MGTAKAVPQLYAALEPHGTKTIWQRYHSANRICWQQGNPPPDQLRLQHLPAIARQPGSQWMEGNDESLLLVRCSCIGWYLEPGRNSWMVGTFKFYLPLNAG